jgi:hypothetical protein
MWMYKYGIIMQKYEEVNIGIKTYLERHPFLKDQ